jgi:signal transduction protein with GAF and PtsI domain
MDAPKGDLSEKLQRLIETLDVANVLTEPLRESITRLLQVSAAELDSDEASVLVRDDRDGGLRFLCVIGSVAEKLVNVHVPAGKGIAGFVFSSGQPMAVSDVSRDEAFYSEVDRTTGYSTHSVLATPLNHNGEPLGVLEYVNRRGDPPYAPFTPDEMDRAAAFAEAIASLVSAYEAAKIFRDLSGRVLSEGDNADTRTVRAWLEELRGSMEHREMMDLAVMLREIASRGTAERRMCREVLHALLGYVESADAGRHLGL